MKGIVISKYSVLDGLTSSAESPCIFVFLSFYS